MTTSLTPLLQESKSALILLPQNPNFDEVAAACTLFVSLDKSKEDYDVTISCPTPMLVEFNRVVGVDKVSQEVENKNLVVSLNEYPPENVERVSCNVVNQEFVLTIIPKPGVTSPKKSELKISYSGLSVDLIVLVGGKSVGVFPMLAKKENIAGIKLAHIGTRMLEGEDMQIASFESAGSSVSEVIHGVIEDSKLDIDQDMATNLIGGIENGSKNFTGEGVTATTFETIAKLMKKGGKRLTAQKRLSDFQPIRSPFENIEKKETVKEAAPADWLAPRIYKGKTNI